MHTKDVPKHQCTKNHLGSSKSMYVEGILDLITEAWDIHYIGVKYVVSDDDTTIQEHLKHSIAETIQLGLMNKNDWTTTDSGTQKRTLDASLFASIHQTFVQIQVTGKKW